MTPNAWNDVDEYLCDSLVAEDAALVAAREDAARLGLPDHHVAPNQGCMLMLLAQTTGARRILEVGTLAGYSTIWLARALAAGGTVDTLEVDPSHIRCARNNFQRAGLAETIMLHPGPARETLAQFVDDGADAYDFIFIDADKPNNPHYLEAALALSHPGTLIVVDNVVREGEVTNPESDDPRVLGVRRMFELIRDEPRLRATAIQTVGSKGWDGFALLHVGEG
ncbi:MAG: O-methyltransferase [Myxococcota bacterium]|jgi:predicted O-methyltransferase YrrM|nr:O-methyltransferase [Myxococcota bacterium]